MKSNFERENKIELPKGDHRAARLLRMAIGGKENVNSENLPKNIDLDFGNIFDQQENSHGENLKKYRNALKKIEEYKVRNELLAKYDNGHEDSELPKREEMSRRYKLMNPYNIPPQTRDRGHTGGKDNLKTINKNFRKLKKQFRDFFHKPEQHMDRYDQIEEEIEQSHIDEEENEKKMANRLGYDENGKPLK